MLKSSESPSGDSKSDVLIDPRTDPRSPASPIAMSVGKVIRWTSNLIATGLVIVIVTNFGPELVSSVLPSKAPNYAEQLDIVEDWPTFQQCNLEFGDVGYQLTRAHFSGGTAEVFDLLEGLCREQLENEVKPFGKIGVQEKKFIEAQGEADPVETVPGKYRIFCERSLPMLAGFPTAVGIRDDCERGEAADGNSAKHGSSSRMAVWAMAMPIDVDEWTTFVGTSANEANGGWLDRMIPPDSIKNISLSDKRGGAVIGFTGENLEQAVEFYQGLEKEQNCELQDVQTAATNWNASVVLRDGEKIIDLRIQLAQPKGESMTGILMKKTSEKSADSSRSQLTLREGNKYE